MGERVIFVIFGASGDLTKRKLVPAIFSLTCEGFLPPEDIAIVGFARTDLDNDSFRRELFKGVENYSRISTAQCRLWPNISERVVYHRGDYGDIKAYEELKNLLNSIEGKLNIPGGRYIFYLATPPDLYSTVIEHLGSSGLTKETGSFPRIVIEKPFGYDLKSAIELNNILHKYFREEQIYRIDHYLGKDTVQDLFVFRFGNAIFEPIWNRNYVDNIQMTVAESEGIGTRAGYYEKAGVLKDMFQNHLLQLLTLVTMEPPIDFSEKSIRDEKVKILRAIRGIKPDQSYNYTVRGQYTGYREERGVSPHSNTATFGVLKLYIDNWRWQGVPFYLRSGKKMKEKMTYIAVRFKDVPYIMFPYKFRDQISSNILYLWIQPNEGIRLRFNVKRPGMEMNISPVIMDFTYSDVFEYKVLPDAYERLILDIINGDPTLFTRNDEIELAWRFIDPIAEGWMGKESPPLAFYEGGSLGPKESDDFILRDGRNWL